VVLNGYLPKGTTMQFTFIHLANFRAYEKVCEGAKFNMFDSRARRATGLTDSEYSFVMANYTALKKEAEKETT